MFGGFEKIFLCVTKVAWFESAKFLYFRDLCLKIMRYYVMCYSVRHYTGYIRHNPTPTHTHTHTATPTPSSGGCITGSNGRVGGGGDGYVAKYLFLEIFASE